MKPRQPVNCARSDPGANSGRTSVLGDKKWCIICVPFCSFQRGVFLFGKMDSPLRKVA